MIKRFDVVEFRVLSCGETGGYYPSGEEAERAKKLMKEGVFERNPETNWRKTGWRFTAKGKKYYSAFVKKMRESHGHIWKTNRDSYPDLYSKDDKYGKMINMFAYETGYHNGMECKKCGYSFCHHCTSEMEVPHCAA